MSQQEGRNTRVSLNTLVDAVSFTLRNILSLQLSLIPRKLSFNLYFRVGQPLYKQLEINVLASIQIQKLA